MENLLVIHDNELQLIFMNEMQWNFNTKSKRKWGITKHICKRVIVLVAYAAEDDAKYIFQVET
jgi:hypothetical protein